ncbi:MAG TPA: hypothetical protein DCP06_04980 [Lachnospiraceae bacterium]|nr:hypothetical protein [Lachnospiraceae bacterium]
MEFLKQLKWSIIVLALAYVVLGVVLILYPVQTQTAVTYILAIALIAMGIINLIQYARLDATALVNSYDLVIGFSGIIGGILIIINVEKFAQMLWIALGFMVLISGVLKLQSSVNLMRLKSTSWHIPFALALINIVFGVIMLINPFSDELFLIMLGIGFIFSGVTDIIVTLMVSARLKTVTDIIMSSGNDGAGSQTM